MDWAQIIAIIGSNLVMTISVMGYAITMHLSSNNRMDENRRESNEILRGIQSEIKDFHDRLYLLEQRKKGK